MNDFKTDAELARKGDTAAFSRLYSMVYKEMYHTALYNLRSPHDAADAVSDTVADAFETIGRLKNAEAFRAWIMKILFAKIKKRQKEYMNSNAELDDALQSLMFRWNICYERYSSFRLSDNEKKKIGLIIQSGIDFLQKKKEVPL